MIKVFEAFAGYGGASFGLKKANIEHQVVGYSEIDKFAIELYNANFPDTKNFGDITQINPKELPDFDLFTGGFPCQPFSQVGLNRGESDIRGTLFHNILNICEVKRPKYILLENVKGLLTKRHEKTLQTIIVKLQKLGYSVEYKLLNSKDYGIPQNRERVWIYGYLGKFSKDFTIEPEKEELKLKFSDFLDKTPPSYLFLNNSQIERLKELYGLDFIVAESSCVDLYNKNGISKFFVESY